MDYIIQRLNPAEILEAIELISQTFQQFVAPDYEKKGVESFYNFINLAENIEKMEFFGAFDDSNLTGVLSTINNRSHICCFFVKADAHRRGIAKSLFSYLLKHSTNNCYTVNSSPYAAEFYKKKGFVPTNSEQIADGIRFTPMTYKR